MTKTEKTITVTWRFGGKMQDKTVEIAAGKTLSPPKNPHKEGRVFLGWYTNKNCPGKHDEKLSGTKIAGKTKAGQKNATYYAHWESVK